MPNLTYVGGNMDIAYNAQMNSFNATNLGTVQGQLAVVNNSQLGNINGLPGLNFVGYGLDLEGSFSK